MGKIIVPSKEILIPRVAVRPLLPPPPTFSARPQPQHLHWQVGRYTERLTSGPGGLGRGKIWVVEKEAEQHNLILDVAYDNLIPTHGLIALSNYAVVGTGSTPPAATQTTLVNEVARTIRDPSGNTSGTRSITRPSDGVYDIKVERQFDPAQVSGRNLTEWGFSPTSGANAPLMCRELFRDGNGDPIVITLDPDQFLRLIYTYRVVLTPVYSNRQPHSITIANLGTFTGYVWCYGNAQADLYTASASVRGTGIYTGLHTGRPDGYSGTAYDVEIYPNVRAIAHASSTMGARQRTLSPVEFGTGLVNDSWATIGLSGSTYTTGGGRQYVQLGLVFVLDSPQVITKTSEYKLIIGDATNGSWKISWGP